MQVLNIRFWPSPGAEEGEIIATLPTDQGVSDRPVWLWQFGKHYYRLQPLGAHRAPPLNVGSWQKETFAVSYPTTGPAAKQSYTRGDQTISVDRKQNHLARVGVRCALDQPDYSSLVCDLY